DAILNVSRFLNADDDLDFSFLNAVTAVDYVEYFELVYHLVSMRKNTSVVIKSKVFGREELSVPSVISVWQGADLQEREVWDLMGIRFEGHPNLKRVLLWEGFPGHPLRKDFLE
ncbi:MAG: NADH-quinone oxidoreductase subunit C, partial [Chloroflexi bacterium]|nr:NADH-quinone oxidoreductase subunit C [Chloroflexota bacterium]